MAVTAIDARAELVDIRWDSAGLFETTMQVAPGKFAEVCGQLAKDQSVAQKAFNSNLRGQLMKSLNTFVATAALIGASAFTLVAVAQSTPAPAPIGEMKMDKPAAAGDMTEGEIRKVDKDTKKITIKHGEIKNLDMPGMTMLFQVKDPAMLDMVKAGDKVKFKAEKAATGIVVTEIQMAK